MGGSIWHIALYTALIVFASTPTPAATGALSESKQLSRGVINGYPYIDYVESSLRGERMQVHDLYCYIPRKSTPAASLSAMRALLEIGLLTEHNTGDATLSLSKHLISDLCYSESETHWIDVVLTGRVITVFHENKEFIILEGASMVGTEPSLLYFGKLVNRKNITS